MVAICDLYVLYVKPVVMTAPRENPVILQNYLPAHHALRRALLTLTSSIVAVVSFVDHEMGRQKSQASVTPVPIVIEQPPRGSITASSVASFQRRP